MIVITKRWVARITGVDDQETVCLKRDIRIPCGDSEMLCLVILLVKAILAKPGWNCRIMYVENDQLVAFQKIRAVIDDPYCIGRPAAGSGVFNVGDIRHSSSATAHTRSPDWCGWA